MEGKNKTKFTNHNLYFFIVQYKKTTFPKAKLFSCNSLGLFKVQNTCYWKLPVKSYRQIFLLPSNHFGGLAGCKYKSNYFDSVYSNHVYVCTLKQVCIYLL